MNAVLIIISVTGNVIPSVGEFSPLTGFERLELSIGEIALRMAQGWGVSRISGFHHFHCSSIFSGLLMQKAMFSLLPSFSNPFSLSH